MYKIDMKKIREEKDILQCAKDMKEAAKNPLVPGARIIRGADAVPVYVNDQRKLKVIIRKNREIIPVMIRQ